MAKVWLSSIKLACHALLWINGHGHRDSVPSLHTTSLSVNSNSSYHRDRKLTNVLEGDALHLLLIWGETNNSRCWLSNWPKTLNVWKLLTGRLVNTQLLILMACKMSWRLKMSLPFLSALSEHCSKIMPIQQAFQNSFEVPHCESCFVRIDESSQSPACAQQLESGVRKSKLLSLHPNYILASACQRLKSSRNISQIGVRPTKTASWFLSSFCSKWFDGNLTWHGATTAMS